MKAIMNTFFLGVPEWREIADFGTFPDLNHLLEGVERSESVIYIYKYMIMFKCWKFGDPPLIFEFVIDLLVCVEECCN